MVVVLVVLIAEHPALSYVSSAQNTHPHEQQDSLKTEENMKRELKVRLALAGFLKDTLTEITNKKVRLWSRLGGVVGGCSVDFE